MTRKIEGGDAEERGERGDGERGDEERRGEMKNASFPFFFLVVARSSGPVAFLGAVVSTSYK